MFTIGPRAYVFPCNPYATLHYLGSSVPGKTDPRTIAAAEYLPGIINLQTRLYLWLQIEIVLVNRWLPQRPVRIARQEVQAIFFRRRHQARRPAPAKIGPGRPVPTMGPGTEGTVKLSICEIPPSANAENPAYAEARFAMDTFWFDQFTIESKTGGAVPLGPKSKNEPLKPIWSLP